MYVKSKIRSKTKAENEMLDWVMAIDICPQTWQQMRS